MQAIIDNVCVKYVDIGELSQEDNNFRPVDYIVGIEFFGIDYTWCINIEELKEYLETGIISCNNFAGDNILFSSAAEFFEDNPDYAQILVDTIEKTWDDAFPNSIYNFIGDERSI